MRRVRWREARRFVLLLAASVASVATVAVGATTAAASSSTWTSQRIARVEGNVTWTVAMTTHAAHVTSTFGLASSASDATSSLAVGVRVDAQGVVELWTGTHFVVGRRVTVSPQRRYLVDVIVDVINHRDSVYLTPSSGFTVRLAVNLPFGSAARSTTALRDVLVDAPSGGVTLSGGVFTPSASSSWPNATNTGYDNAPGYPGTLSIYDGPANGSALTSNTTYRFLEFPAGITVPATVHNVTFVGCDFRSSGTWNNVVTYGDNVSFNYVTTEPATVHMAPVTNAQGYQYPILQNGGSGLTVDHGDFWGYGNAIQFGTSNAAAPLVVENSWFHNLRDPNGGVGGPDHQDGVLENYGHQSYVTLSHNAIIAVGNTNAVALQGSVYDHLTITGNYLSGFGYTVNIGGAGASVTNLTFSNNTFGTDVAPVYGPLYGWTPGITSNVWSCNRIDVVPGTSWTSEPEWTPVASDNGKFWLPTVPWVDPASATDYLGHTSCPSVP